MKMKMKMKLRQTISALYALIAMYMARAGLLLGALSMSVEKDAWSKLAKEIQALYVEKDGKYALDVDGLDDTGGLKSALVKERDKARAEEKLRKELEKRFDGIDPDAVREMMARFENDEDSKLIAKGKIDEVVSKRVEQMKKGFEKQLSDEAKKTAIAEERSKKFSQRVLDNHIRAAATKAGIHAHAVEDALFRARSMFSLNDDGDAVQLDDGGHAKPGKDGKTPYSPSEWLDTMKETAPHWFPANSGGSGAQGDRGATGGKRVVKRADFNKMDPATQSATAKDKTVAFVD